MQKHDSNHETLRAHVAVCPSHPAAAFKKRVEVAEALAATHKATLKQVEHWISIARAGLDEGHAVTPLIDDVLDCLAAALAEEP